MIRHDKGAFPEGRAPRAPSYRAARRSALPSRRDIPCPIADARACSFAGIGLWSAKKMSKLQSPPHTCGGDGWGDMTTFCSELLTKYSSAATRASGNDRATAVGFGDLLNFFILSRETDYQQTRSACSHTDPICLRDASLCRCRIGIRSVYRLRLHIV